MLRHERELITVELLTERLRLVPISLDNDRVIFQEFTSEVTRYMFPKPASRIEETREFIQGALEGMRGRQELQLVILERLTGGFVGCVGVHDLDQPDPEIGIWTKTSSHGNGYGLEACSALLDWVHQNLEFDHIRYPVDKRNRASRRIAEFHNGRIGREFRGLNLSGVELDQVEYWIPPRRAGDRSGSRSASPTIPSLD